MCLTDGSGESGGRSRRQYCLHIRCVNHCLVGGAGDNTNEPNFGEAGRAEMLLEAAVAPAGERKVTVDDQGRQVTIGSGIVSGSIEKASAAVLNVELDGKPIAAVPIPDLKSDFTMPHSAIHGYSMPTGYGRAICIRAS